MNYKNTSGDIEYFIVYTDPTEPIFGSLNDNGEVGTPHTTIETFVTEQEMIDRLDVLTGVTDYWQSQQPEEDPVPEPLTPEQLQAIRSTMVVSPWQFRKALNQTGDRDAVEAAVAAADIETQDGWNFATSFERLHPMIINFGVLLGKTDEELDDLFRLARSL